MSESEQHHANETSASLVSDRGFTVSTLASAGVDTTLDTKSQSKMIGDEGKVSMARLVSYQRAVFVAMFVGYACYTYNRKSVSYAIPTLLASGLINTSTIGIISSCQNIAYAISKFLGGILSDKMSARVLFSIGLAVSGGSTLLFSRTDNAVVWALLWFINGFAQGAGWPACAKLLKKWFSSENFGTWWSVLTASSNVSGTLSPLLAAYVIISHGWSASLVISGLLSLVIAAVTLVTVVDDPVHVHLPDPNTTTTSTINPSHSTTTPPPNKKVESEKMSVKELASSPFLWLVAACYLLVFCTKTALSDWGQIFLMSELGRSQMQASSFTSAMETGGFFGGILAGLLTDKMVRKVKTRGNARLMVAATFMVTCAAAVHVLRASLTPHTSQAVVSVVGMVLGASMYGPISIYGIVASESFPTHLSGTAHAVVALAANVGAVAAGWPLSWVARTWSWSGVLLLLETMAASSVLLILSTSSRHLTPKLKTA